MNRGSLRTALLGSTAAAMLIASAGTANAIEYNFGSVQVFFDTTLSAGVSMRTASTNHLYLPASNGGPQQVTTNNVNLALLPTSAAPTGGDGLTLLTDPTTISGSINTDDGRLNFDRGDLTSAIAKMTNDIQVRWENYTFFTRINSYYDAVLSDSGSYNRSPLVAGEADAARDIRLLDMYVSGNFDVGGLPLTVRAGKQAINWGESTFILNGVNGSMPIDVNAFRRPGAEVKEGLLPIWALNASLGLPYNLSIEAFYQLQQAEYQLDRPGTPFSTSDVVSKGSGVGGNENATSFLTGSYGGTNCNTNNVVATTMQGALPVTDLRNCADLTGINQYLHYENRIPAGMTEAVRFALSDASIVERQPDRLASDSGQYGLAARWYSETLNNTEFGFYFTNTHSRLPIASERVTVDMTNPNSTWAPFTTGQNGSAAGRGAAFQGCNGLAGSPFAPGATATDPTANAFYGVPLGLTPEMVAQLNQTVGNGAPNDPVMDAMEALAVQYYLNEIGGDFAGYVIPAPAATGFDLLTGGYLTTNRTFAGMDLSALGTTLGLAGAGSLVGVTVAPNSGLQAALVNCALVALQSNAALGGALLTDGAQVLIASTGFGGPATVGLYLEYPEDIRMYGFSFNTTVGTWGVQGDFTYRPNQPVQLDTDQLTIAGLNSACVFHGILGATTMASLAGQDTYGAACGDMGVGSNAIDLQGYERTKIYTAQVGTTATFTNSNQLIELTGADLGILVTEFGMMYAPDTPKGVGTNLRWGNVCASGGTDLPLGSFLSLAARQGCRPTSVSYGYVLLGQLQYNNAFGTPISLQPTIAWNHGVQGNSPAPLSNYRQGAKSVSLALNGNYLGNWRGGISYTNFFGNEKYVGNTDQDFVSANISYAF